MNIGTPEIAYFCLTGLNLLAAAVLDGEPKKGKWSLSAQMLSSAMGFGLLWWGGFFA